MATAAILLAGLWPRGTSRRLSRAFVLAVVLIAVAVGLNILFSFETVERHYLWHLALGSAVLVLGSAILSRLSPFDIALLSLPFVILCIGSIVRYPSDHTHYLFPWYNTWGLVGAVLVGSALSIKAWRAWFRYPILVIGLASVALSTSRQALAALALLFIVVAAQSRSIGARIRVIIILGLGAAIAFDVFSHSSRIEALGSISDANGRQSLLASALGIVHQSPVFGISQGTFDSSYSDTLSIIGLGWSDSVHNLLLDSWIRGGLLGLIASAVLVVCVVMPRAWRSSFGPRISVVSIPFLMLGSQLLYYEEGEGAILLALIYGFALSQVFPRRVANE